MNFKEYINQDTELRHIKILGTGDVLVNEDDVFKQFSRTERHPKTDKKYTQFYISLLIEGKVYTYKLDNNNYLKTNFNTYSVFKLNYNPNKNNNTF